MLMLREQVRRLPKARKRSVRVIVAGWLGVLRESFAKEGIAPGRMSSTLKKKEETDWPSRSVRDSSGRWTTVSRSKGLSGKGVVPGGTRRSLFMANEGEGGIGRKRTNKAYAGPGTQSCKAITRKKERREGEKGKEWRRRRCRNQRGQVSDWMGEAESHGGPPGWWASWETRISWPLALLEQHP